MEQVRLGTASPWGAVSGSDGAGSGLCSRPCRLPGGPDTAFPPGALRWGIPYLPQVSCSGSTPHVLLAALILFEGGGTHLHFTSNSLWLQPANHSPAHLPGSSELSPPTLSLSRHRVRSAPGQAWGGAGDQPWTGQRDPLALLRLQLILDHGACRLVPHLRRLNSRLDLGLAPSLLTRRASLFLHQDYS